MGSNIRLPAVNRLNMASLPIGRQLRDLTGRLLPLLEGLKVLSSNRLRVDQSGAIHFMEE